MIARRIRNSQELNSIFGQMRKGLVSVGRTLIPMIWTNEDFCRRFRLALSDKMINHTSANLGLHAQSGEFGRIALANLVSFYGPLTVMKRLQQNIISWFPRFGTK